jgi:DNA-binding NarL/FixJ family response regulator
MKANIALVDDHVLLRNGLAALLKDLGCTIVLEADNGVQLIEKLKTSPLPQIILMDINMPLMDGFESTLWLKKNYPNIKVLALSMLDDEQAIIRMIKNGARGYVLKDSDPDELSMAIESVMQKGFFHSELVSSKLIHALSQDDGTANGTSPVFLTEKEIEFLKWVCTDLSYKEIAEKMHVSPRTIDGYRDAMHEKLDVKSRVSMAIFAIRKGIVSI